MKKVLITQRIDKIGSFNEERDNLDVNLIKFLEKVRLMPILLPNRYLDQKTYIKKIKPDGIILSGGGDPLKKDQRRKNEINLIKYSITKNIPLIGICRGAQVINLFYGGQIKKVKGHVRKFHKIKLDKGKKIKVNSFHDLGFDENMLGKELISLSKSNDGIVKYFRHKKLNIFGIMWHPERNKKFQNYDLKLFKNIISI